MAFDRRHSVLTPVADATNQGSADGRVFAVTKLALRPVFVALVALVTFGGCGSSGPVGSDGGLDVTAGTPVTPTSEPTGNEGPADPTATKEPTTLDSPAHLVPEIISRRGHDTAAFTQGLEYVDGRLYESRGRRGTSALTEVDPQTGSILRSRPLDDAYFAEGLTAVGDRLIQLTWLSGTAFVYDVDTFEVVDTHRYTGEGWGLCFDGTYLVMSDGSSRLTYRDPGTFEPQKQLEVTLSGVPVQNLNELECVEEQVYANVWQTNALVVIGPDGAVTAVVDASSLLEQDLGTDADSLNGIALDPASGRFLLTGKLWNSMFEVDFVPIVASES